MAYIVTIEYSNPGVITRVRNSELDIPRYETPMGGPHVAGFVLMRELLHISCV